MAGIYVHIPFCTQACHYCDFHFSTSLKLLNDVVKTIKDELISRKKYITSSPIETVYFGGGTPSLLPSQILDDILLVIKENFRVVNTNEVTLEVNPENVTKQNLIDWYNLGITRLSLGVQSFFQEDLDYMNRSHDSRQAFEALELLQNSKIKNLSVDLIYGYPLLSDDKFVKNIQYLIKMKVPHISSYCLTVEKGTALSHFIKDKKHPPLNPQKQERQFYVLRNLLLDAGYEHYEISNFSQPEYRALHNQNYWNKTPYLGVGPSAHSYNGKSRQWNVKNNSVYCKNYWNKTKYYEEEYLSRKDIINEYVITSLRTSDGIFLETCFSKMSRLEVQLFKKNLKSIEKHGLIYQDGGFVILTEKGMLFADSISRELFLI